MAPSPRAAHGKDANGQGRGQGLGDWFTGEEGGPSTSKTGPTGDTGDDWGLSAELAAVWDSPAVHESSVQKELGF